jgi:hypothetical protein
VTNVVNLFSKEGAKANKGRTELRADLFLSQILRPALQVSGFHSRSAEVLLLGTALTESDLDSVKQFNDGPALSFFQIEPETYHDCIRYLKTCRAKGLKERILSACFIDVFPPAECLTWNLRLSCLIARVKYWMRPEPLPKQDDAAALCKYYLKYYNTNKGKATYEKSMLHFSRASLI